MLCSTIMLAVLRSPPESSCNFCKLQDTELSDLIDKGNAELTFEARKPYFDEYQEKVVEKAAMGYLYTKNLLTAYNKSMKNLKWETGQKRIKLLILEPAKYERKDSHVWRISGAVKESQ